MSVDPARDNAAPALDVGTSLAFERTYLAHERTQMAWIRTALSLISFGFTISKFFEYLDQKHAGPATFVSPRTVGILMISLGLVFLGLATLQHWQALRKLHARCPSLPRSLSWVTATLLALLGLFALVSAIVRG